LGRFKAPFLPPYEIWWHTHPECPVFEWPYYLNGPFQHCEGWSIIMGWSYLCKMLTLLVKNKVNTWVKDVLTWPKVTNSSLLYFRSSFVRTVKGIFNTRTVSWFTLQHMERKWIFISEKKCHQKNVDFVKNISFIKVILENTNQFTLKNDALNAMTVIRALFIR